MRKSWKTTRMCPPVKIHLLTERTSFYDFLEKQALKSICCFVAPIWMWLLRTFCTIGKVSTTFRSQVDIFKITLKKGVVTETFHHQLGLWNFLGSCWDLCESIGAKKKLLLCFLTKFTILHLPKLGTQPYHLSIIWEFGYASCNNSVKFVPTVIKLGGKVYHDIVDHTCEFQLSSQKSILVPKLGNLRKKVPNFGTLHNSGNFPGRVIKLWIYSDLVNITPCAEFGNSRSTTFASII